MPRVSPVNQREQEDVMSAPGDVYGPSIMQPPGTDGRRFLRVISIARLRLSPAAGKKCLLRFLSRAYNVKALRSDGRQSVYYPPVWSMAQWRLCSIKEYCFLVFVFFY